ncbi:MAG: A24 family peptidase [Phenylobacterium sp.]|nr:A24 family peptidase [Phenylobacterium sp.]
MSNLEIALNLALLALLAGSVFSDVTRRLIPNFVCLGVFLLGLVHAVLISTGDWIYSLVGCGIVLLGGLALHQKKVLGGGDIKLITALSIWLMPIELARFVLSIMFAGGLVGAGYLAVGFVRRLRDKTAPAAAGVPYALAIVGGFLVLRPEVLTTTVL